MRCGVFRGGKNYHYRTTDLRIAVNDIVIVPVGSENYEREATVKTVEFYRWDNTPYPLEKTKQILRKAGDEVFDASRFCLSGEVITGNTEEDDDEDTGRI